MRRRSGGRLRPGCETTRPPTRMVPQSGSMKPATRRNVVVLPQPDGPSRQHNEPCATVSVRSSTAAAVPKNLVSASSSTTAMKPMPLTRLAEAVHYISRETRESPLSRGWRRTIDTRPVRRPGLLRSGDAVVLEPGEHLGPAILCRFWAVGRPVVGEKGVPRIRIDPELAGLARRLAGSCHFLDLLGRDALIRAAIE